jgi:hypothetical protein
MIVARVPSGNTSGITTSGPSTSVVGTNGDRGSGSMGELEGEIDGPEGPAMGRSDVTAPQPAAVAMASINASDLPGGIPR